MLLCRTLFLLLALVLARTRVEAAEGVQVTPDGKASLVTKDVNGERWAIHFSTASDTPLTVTGNVFRGEGSEPAFVYCTPIDATGDVNDIANVVFTFRCLGNDRCTNPTPPCQPWTLIGNVELRGGFFLPP